MTRALSGSLCILLASVLPAGCSPAAWPFGKEYEFGNVTPTLSTPGHVRIVVATADWRPSVVTGYNPPTFVGWQYGGYGAAWAVRTESDRALADEWSDAVVRALQAAGYEAVPLYPRRPRDNEEVRQLLAASGRDRQLLFGLEVWESASYFHATMNASIWVRVFDHDGSELAYQPLQGKVALKGDVDEAVPLAMQEQIELLMNDPAVALALHPAAPSKPGATNP